MEFSELIRQFAEKSGIEMPEIVDDAVAFDADGTATAIFHQA